MPLRLLFLALAALATPLASAAGAPDSVAAQVDQVFSEYAGRNAPGCAVGVYEHGQVVFAKGYGLADVGGSKPLTPQTLFYAASVSKQFTSLAAALLVEDGKLSLQDDVRKWIPELPDYGTPITVAMLMHHVSGVRDYLDLLGLAGVDEYDTLEVPAVLRILAAQRGVDFEPGTRYAYSNGGYFLLAEVVARASGERFSEFAKKRIFDPLGMKHAYFRDGPMPRDANAAHGYKADGKGSFEAADGYPSVSGSGGLMINLEDLARYDRDFQVGRKVWTPRVREIMLAPGFLADGATPVTTERGHAYAGGLRISRYRGQQRVEHTGSAAGFRNYYGSLPALESGTAVFCNRSDADPQALAGAVVEVFHGGDLVPAEAPPLTLAGMLEGRFRSDELAADYVFSRTAGGLELTVTSPYAGKPRTVPVEKLDLPDGDVLMIPIGEVRVEYGPDRRISAFTTVDGELGGIRFVRTTGFEPGREAGGTSQ